MSKSGKRNKIPEIRFASDGQPKAPATTSRPAVGQAYRPQASTVRPAASAQEAIAEPVTNGAPGPAVLLHPTAPLVFGTGKPLDFGIGGDTLPFPFPATVAGALRAQAGSENAFFLQDTVPVGPPLLVRLDTGHQISRVYLPKPADAVYLAGGQVARLLPSAWPPGTLGDLPSAWPGLRPLRLMPESNAKPGEAPAWWHEAAMIAWLQSGAEPGAAASVALKSSQRTHVVIDGDTLSSSDGGLFRSTGIDFFGDGHQHAIWVSSSLPSGSKVDTGAAFGRRVGGEGRFAFGEAAPALKLQSLDHYEKLRGMLRDAELIRVVLLSPAVFPAGGWLPCWLQAEADHGIRGTHSELPELGKVELVAAALTRTSSFSGWQPAQPGSTQAGPGQAWRVVPAGTVYWFKVSRGTAAAWWWKSLCTGTWAKNGWGCAIVGPAALGGPQTN